jgi:hypothetical protein
VGAAEYDAVVREAMRRMADDALSEDGASAPGDGKRERTPPKKPSPTDPSWSYTNVGEAAAEIVVREAMQRMAEEAELEREAQCEAEHPLSDVGVAADAGESRLQRHLTQDQGLNRLRRRSTSTDDTHRWAHARSIQRLALSLGAPVRASARPQQPLLTLMVSSLLPHNLAPRYHAGQHLEILYVPQRVLGGLDVGHLAVLVKESPDDTSPPTTFSLYGQGFRNGFPVVSREPGVVVSPDPLYAKALADPKLRKQIMRLYVGRLTAEQADKLNLWAEHFHQHRGGHLVTVRGHERGAAPIAGTTYQGSAVLGDNCATWAIRHFAPEGRIECPMNGSLPRLCRATLRATVVHSDAQAEAAPQRAQAAAA